MMKLQKRSLIEPISFDKWKRLIKMSSYVM